jgi:hypothetical protein
MQLTKFMKRWDFGRIRWIEAVYRAIHPVHSTPLGRELSGLPATWKMCYLGKP